ncbi:protease complex subunit PrcB family protein [Brevibacillus sp. SAFN-007a]|uniref:protease complex subunit PrcB family protein n=1 Tax=Brevibacillus sp. SAFN-007a TaxID=3436862 RepID=UPI003F7FF6CB
MKRFPGFLLAASLCVTGAASLSLPHPTASALTGKEAVPSAVEAAPYEAVAAPYPPAVTEALKKVRKTGGHTVVRANGTAYVVIGAGQKPTGGYRLVPEQVTRTGPHGFTIRVHVQPPAPGALKTQAISYPTLVIALPDQQAQVSVHMR